MAEKSGRERVKRFDWAQCSSSPPAAADAERENCRLGAATAA